jgi:hypothetical protein
METPHLAPSPSAIATQGVLSTVRLALTMDALERLITASNAVRTFVMRSILILPLSLPPPNEVRLR